MTPSSTLSDIVPLPLPLMSSTTGPGKRDREGDVSVNMERYGCMHMHTYIAMHICACLYVACLRFSCTAHLLKGLHIVC